MSYIWVSMLNDSPRVLIVDDDENTLSLFAAIMRREGIEVDLISGGRRGLEMLRERSYAAILLDLAMPELDGFEFLGRVEAESPDLLERVLVVTGLPPIHLKKLDRSRISGVIQKPFDIRELVSATRRSMERSLLR